MSLHPAIRSSFLLALLGTVAAGLQAQESAENCAEQTDDRARLACYDRLYNPPPAPAPAPVEPGAGPAETDRPPVAQPAEDAAPAPAAKPSPAPSSEAGSAQRPEFGMDPRLREQRQRETGDTEPEEIEARVVKIQKKPWGEYVLTLDNGQIWEQREVIWSMKFAEGDLITIEKGLFSSYFLRHKDSGRATKVRRIK